MRARQDTVDQTRLRITEATVQLHQEVGPAATTTSAIAELAGVTRLTVYRHFPDDVALLSACSAHWRAEHPRPDVDDWTRIADPTERLRAALRQTYAWAATAAPMMTKILRDVDELPEFVGAAIKADEDRRIKALARGFRARGRAALRLEAALAHALDVRTWQVCHERGLQDEELVDLMCAFVGAAAPARHREVG